MKKLIISIFTLFSLSSIAQIKDSGNVSIIGISRYTYKFYFIDLKLDVKSDYKLYITSPLNDTIKMISISDFNGMYGYILDLTFKPIGTYQVILKDKRDSIISSKPFIIN